MPNGRFSTTFAFLPTIKIRIFNSSYKQRKKAALWQLGVLATALGVSKPLLDKEPTIYKR